MQWYGKAIGGILGLVGGPIGSALGVLIGHQFDVQIEQRKAKRGAHEISQLFFEVTFEVMGHIAKADGRVSEDEIRIARRIMHGMRLSPEQSLTAQQRFTAGKTADYRLGERLAALAEQIGERVELARTFVQVQLQAALGAGELGAEKRHLLWRVASSLELSRAEFAHLEATVRAYEQRGAQASAKDLGDAYRTLGVDENASNEAVKTAYRRLMNQHHPDKLVGRGLPASMAGIAEQKTLQIRAAYERIKSLRGFK